MKRLISFFLILFPLSSSALTVRQQMIVEETCEEHAGIVAIAYREYSRNGRSKLNQIVDAHMNSRDSRVNFSEIDVREMVKMGFILRDKHITKMSEMKKKETPEEDAIRLEEKLYGNCTKRMSDAFENGDLE